MQIALHQLGFQCTLLFDTTRRQMTKAIAAFIASLQPGDLVFIHFSGHGVQSAGITYLMPSDFRRDNLGDDAVSVSVLTQRLNDKDANLTSIIVLDCRTMGKGGSDETAAARPLETDAVRSDQPVPVPSSGHSHFLVAYSSIPATACEMFKGWFAESLLAHLLTPGMRLPDVFHHAVDTLLQKSKGQQRVWLSQTAGTKLGLLTLLPSP